MCQPVKELILLLIQLPDDVRWVMERLEEAGFRAYAVGGCVRDTLLGREPKDWDICTDAQPAQTQAVFSGCRTIETGLKHGTLTVMRNRTAYEVTTFRVDGAYTDHRHPDSVSFVTDVRADLARRDFTVNAMAYRPAEGLVDAFGGREDLRQGLIRCVGDPAARFGEDALRILRALRFAAVYGFEVEADTAEAVRRLCPTLARVAAERIRTEWSKLICGEAAAEVLKAFPEVARLILPELPGGAAWTEALRLLPHQPPEEALRLAALLAPGGGTAAEKAAESVEAMERLKADKATAQLTHTLLNTLDDPLTPGWSGLLRWLNRHGEETLRRILTFRSGLAWGTPEAGRLAETERALDALLRENPCYTLKQLAVNGRDARAAGWRGEEIGRKLQALLESVMRGDLPNERDALLRTLKRADEG